jgi:hypothetical protein
MLLRGFDHGDGDLLVGGFLPHGMRQNKAVLIFQDANTQAQFDGDAGLALADQFGVRLKQRKHPFGMGDGFAF